MNQIKNTKIKESTFDFKLLQEEAVNVDSFDDKTHEKVADQLCRIINTNEIGLTIGLEGPWGSGKSTVVNIFKKKLNERTLFFNFDTWAHEGDPLRRIFLENLILSADPDQRNSVLQEVQKEISGRTKKVEIKSKSKSSRLGTLIGLSALLVPFGVAILSGIDYKAIAMPWSDLKGDIAALFWLASSFVFAPVLIAICWSIFGEKDSSGFLGKDWSVIQGSTSENYTQDITEETERSSVEFEYYFKKILKILVSEKKLYDRIVIVIDNLDRIAPETAKSIWSVLQTFLQHKNSYSSFDTSKIWFLIPYDKEGISSIWGANNENRLCRTTKSFIEKSIQIVVDVPAPIYSSWAKHLQRLASEALHGWRREDKKTAISVFKRFESTLNSVPTPRHMRRYINQIGTIALRWGNEVSIEAIALFALLKIDHNSNEIQEYLINDKLPKEYKCITDSKLVHQELAGMLFGVTPKKGVELLLGRELETAIRNGDRERVAKLADHHKNAMIAVCHSVLPKIAPTLHHIPEYNIHFSYAVVELFTRFGVSLRPDSEQFKNFWLDIHTKWEFDKADYTPVLDALYELDFFWHGFEIIRDKAFQLELEKCISTIGTNDFNLFSLKNLNLFYSTLKKYTDPITKKIHYESLDKSNFTTWLDLVKDNKLSLPFVYPKIGTIQDLSSQLNNSNPPEPICIALTKCLPAYAEESEWDLAISFMLKWLTNPGRALNNNSAYQLLCSIASYLGNNALEEIRLALGNPNFKKRAQQYQLEQVPALCALTAIVFGEKIQNQAGLHNIKDFWSNPINTNHLDATIKQLDNVGKSSKICHVAKDKRNLTAVQYIESNPNIDVTLESNTATI